MNINKIFFISDLHFGVRSNALEWLDIQQNYFYNWFIPMLKQKVQQGDVLFVLGDIFDSRQSVNVLILNSAIQIFEEISKILPVYIILGNHDTYRKNTNDIYSTKIFEYIKNVNIFKEPEVVTISKNNIHKNILLMPWRKNIEEENKAINDSPDCNYLFCHTDIKGIQYNLVRTVDMGNDINIYKKYDKVFSGHIHYRQESNNLIIVGSPYALTRSDTNNKKGIYIFDPFENTYEFIENNYSPKFIKLDIEEVMEYKLGKFLSIIKNNFVDITVNINWSLNFPFTILMDNLYGYRKINVISIIDNNMSSLYEDNSSTDLSNFDIIKLSQVYIENLNYSPKIKGLMQKKIHELHDRVMTGGYNE